MPDSGNHTQQQESPTYEEPEGAIRGFPFAKLNLEPRPQRSWMLWDTVHELKFQDIRSTRPGQ